jgi:hypothetical protein
MHYCIFALDLYSKYTYIYTVYLIMIQPLCLDFKCTKYTFILYCKEDFPKCFVPIPQNDNPPSSDYGRTRWFGAALSPFPLTQFRSSRPLGYPWVSPARPTTWSSCAPAPAWTGTPGAGTAPHWLFRQSRDHQQLSVPLRCDGEMMRFC